MQEGVRCLLPCSKSGKNARKCVVIDLDETLVHSSFKAWMGVRDVVMGGESNCIVLELGCIGILLVVLSGIII